MTLCAYELRLTETSACPVSVLLEEEQSHHSALQKKRMGVTPAHKDQETQRRGLCPVSVTIYSDLECKAFTLPRRTYSSLCGTLPPRAHEMTHLLHISAPDFQRRCSKPPSLMFFCVHSDAEKKAFFFIEIRHRLSKAKKISFQKKEFRKNSLNLFF